MGCDEFSEVMKRAGPCRSTMDVAILSLEGDSDASEERND
jgi:hypothetical protein